MELNYKETLRIAHEIAVKYGCAENQRESEKDVYNRNSNTSKN